MKAEWEMTLFDDKETEQRLNLLNRIEVMFDHSKNQLPYEYFWFTDRLPLGSKVKVIFEVVE